MKKILAAFLLFTIALPGFSSNGKKQIRLRLTDSTTYVFDETAVYLDLGSPQFIYPEDGQKIFDTASSAPSLYSFSRDNVSCFSNSYGNFTPAMVIPLGFKVSDAGTFKISTTLLDNFDPTSIIRLEDRTLGVFHDLRQGDYTIYLNQAGQDDARFFIHLSYPSIISTIDAGCSNNDGNILVQQDSSLTWSNCILYDNNFNQLNSYSNITGNISFTGLPFGSYKIVFAYGSYTALKNVVLSGRSVTVSVSANTVNGLIGQQLQFFSAATNATDYLWEFGEGSEIDGVMNPNFAYTQAGVYNVTVRASNSFGCEAFDNLTVTISEATGINNLAGEDVTITTENKMLRIQFSKQFENENSFQVFSTTGQLMFSNTITSTQTNADLSGLSSGIYIVKVQQPNGSFSKKIVLQ